MRKQYHFTLAENGLIVNELIIGYFSRQGFSIVSEETNKLFFARRGNVISDLLRSNPLQWSSQVIVTRKGNEIFTHALITSFSLKVSEKTDQIWDQFFMNLQTTLNENSKT